MRNRGFFTSAIACLSLVPLAAAVSADMTNKKSFSMVETSFQLSDGLGDLFAAEIWAIVHTPDGRDVRVPAFYDGGLTWRARYMPNASGRHRVSIFEGPADEMRPASAEEIKHAFFIVEGRLGPGFIRRDAADPRSGIESDFFDARRRHSHSAICRFSTPDGAGQSAS